MLFISPDHDFLPEHKIATKIQIDNSLELGWKAEDLILATNFPYEYGGVKSLLVNNNNYSPFCPTVSIINVIVELFDRKIIKRGEVWWYHDHDAYQLYGITESELDLGKADMAMAYKGLKAKWDTGSIFFKSSAEDIIRRLKETANKYQVNEEYALMALYTNNLLWITETESDARAKFVPLNVHGSINLTKRIKTLNLRYLFGADCIDFYQLAKKPIKVVHFHFTNDLYLDSAMYGKSSLKKPLMTKRLIKIFHKHKVKGIFPKKMKNLMIYLNPQKKFQEKAENLVKTQINNSLKLGWRKQDIIILTNFPYQYKGIKAMLLKDDLFSQINPKAFVSNAIFHLLDQGFLKEGEIWWYHELNILQNQPLKASEIELEGATAGFTNDKRSQFDFGSFFFRKGANKLFEWIRNRTLRLNSTEAAALMSLASTNYRNINTLYKMLPKKLAKIFNKN